MRVVLVLAGFLAGLAGSNAQAASPACALLSQAEASAIFGQTLQPGQDNGAPNMDACYYPGADTDSGVSVTLFTPGDGGTTQAMYGSMTSVVAGTALTNSGETPVPVSGLGDAATYEYSATDSVLWILVGTKIYGLEANQSNNPNVKAALIAAGRKVIGG